MLESRVSDMASQLRHRGPDDEGYWVDPSHGIAFGFQRLAVIDPTETGRQPMTSSSGRYVVVYNGEIYNYDAIRDELLSRGHTFRGTSDTEVFLTAVERWGLQPTLERAIGMFAIALWDTQEERLLLARDRIGEKPLYYGSVDGSFVFGSELKSLLAHPDLTPRIDRRSLSLYLRYGYVPTPRSIFQGIQKLPPGTWVSVSAPDTVRSPRAFWSVQEAARKGALEPFRGSLDAASEELEDHLFAVVERSMVADVPLGVFLSGGIDSSTVTAIMQEISDQPVRTFTIGFEEAEYNEAEDAARIADHLGTDHTEKYIEPKEAREVIPDLPSLYDEPFADSSQIPTHLVSRLAREHVTVSLSGDGGDELFGGYGRHRLVERVWDRVRWVPEPLRRVGASLFRATGQNGHAAALELPHAQSLHDYLIHLWHEPPTQHEESPESTILRTPPSEVRDPVDQSMIFDLQNYLVDDILVKVDRASMGASLEVRAPYLNHDLVEFALRLPRRTKLEGGRTKIPLRRVLEKYVPARLVDRPKSGFGVPIGRWLRGPLRPWARDLLDSADMREQGFIDPKPVQTAWEQHQSREEDHTSHLWTVLMFQSWLRRFEEELPP